MGAPRTPNAAQNTGEEFSFKSVEGAIAHLVKHGLTKQQVGTLVAYGSAGLALASVLREYKLNDWLTKKLYGKRLKSDSSNAAIAPTVALGMLAQPPLHNGPLVSIANVAARMVTALESADELLVELKAIHDVLQGNVELLRQRRAWGLEQQMFFAALLCGGNALHVELRPRQLEALAIIAGYRLAGADLPWSANESERPVSVRRTPVAMQDREREWRSLRKKVLPLADALRGFSSDKKRAQPPSRRRSKKKDRSDTPHL